MSRFRKSILLPVLVLGLILPIASHGQVPPTPAPIPAPIPAPTPAPQPVPKPPPIAALRGPVTVTPDVPFLLTVSGSAADHLILQAQGPSPVDPILLYNEQGIIAGGLAQATTPGTYTFVLIAVNDAAIPDTDQPVVPPAKRRPIVNVALWPVQVGTVPPPKPPVPPGPVPPGPEPPPVPPTPIVPLTTKLSVIAFYSDDLTNTAELVFAPVKDSLTIAKSLNDLNTGWRCWHISNQQIDKLGLRAHVPGKLPAVLIYDKTRFYDPPAVIAITEPGIIAAVKKLRGQ